MRFILLILFFTSTYCYGKDSINWDPVIKAIAYVESRENPKAIGKGESVGLLQITPILVKECNIILKEKKYTLNDRLNPEKSKEMFILIQRKYNPQNNIERAVRLWNGGPNYSIIKTQKYYIAVLKRLT